MSVSRYVREAALARAAFSAGARAEVPTALLTRWARAVLAADAGADDKRRAAERLAAALDHVEHRHDAAALRDRNRETVEESTALLGQARQTARTSERILRERLERD